jgi:hypothetical protein
MNTEEIGQSLVERLQKAERALTSAHGPFVLFVLAERETAPGKWDLLISAPWLETNRKGIQQIVDALKAYLTPAEWLQLASITPLPPSMDYVQWIARKYDVQHDNQEVINVFWDTLFIPHGYIITANSSLASVMPQAVAA